MNQRQHRKRMQRLMACRWRCPARNPVLFGRIYFASSARRTGKTSAALQWQMGDLADGQQRDDLIDAVKYGFSAIRRDFEQEFVPPPLTELEVVAQRIVQDAELFDRTLDHYVRPGGLEAIPAHHHLGASMRYYEQRLREACARYGSEVRMAARSYSTSSEYAQWLRDNPPEVRR